MLTSFSSLKKERSKTFEDLNKKLQSLKSNSNKEDDDKYWKLSVDNLGNGQAIIRFLPAPVNEDVPFVRMWNHGFKGPNGAWYIENSLTTINKPDPVSEYNVKLWNKDTKEGQAQARNQKRRLNFYSNIYVVNDPGNPENDGKVFLYRFGKKIFEKLNDVMNPKFDGEDRMNPFDFWGGTNFRLRASKGDGGYRTYASSLFDQKNVFENKSDDELEKIWQSQYSLQEIVSPDKFKTYEELNAKLIRVLDLEEEMGNDMPPKKEKETFSDSFSESFSNENDDDSLDLFRKLAADED